MKKTMLMAIIFGAMNVSAVTETIKGIEWTYTVSDGESTITGMYNSSRRDVVEIPEILGGSPVTSIVGLEDFWRWDSDGRPSDALVKTWYFPSTVRNMSSHLIAQSSHSLQLVVFSGNVPSFERGYNLYDSLEPYRVNISYPQAYASQWRAQIETSNQHGGNGYYTQYFAFAGFYRGYVSAEVIKSSIRENDPTIMDVVYKVTSKKSKVKVRVLAFEDGVRSFAKVVRPETFVDGTEVNVGDNVTPNVEHTISWRVSSDWKTKLAKVKFEVMACEGELLPLELMTIPASDQYGKMKISWNALSTSQCFDALLWLYADKTADLSCVNGVLKTGTTQLASGTGISAENAMTYIYGKMGYSRLVGAPLTYANSETRLGLSPSGARQYAYKIVED